MLGELFDPEADVLVSSHCRPHWSQAGAIVFITFRTADSIPCEVIERWDREKREWLVARGYDAARDLSTARGQLGVTHQTGEQDVELVREGYRRASVPARVEPFLFDMHKEMSAADVIVCRAGATTLAEVSACGRAAILVPLPGATDDHQRRNAEAMVVRDAAVMIEQRDLSGERLAREVLALAADAERRHRLGTAARMLARPDAARVIVDRVLALAG